VAQAPVQDAAYLDIPGERFVHDSGLIDPAPGCALIRSLTHRHLV
jgi:hypothetical protein